MLDIKFSNKSWNDYIYWQNNDKKILKKLNSLLEDTRRNPLEDLGKPEPLKGNLSGFYSRRIDKEHRLVYKVENEMIFIDSVKGHY